MQFEVKLPYYCFLAITCKVLSRIDKIVYSFTKIIKWQVLYILIQNYGLTCLVKCRCRFLRNFYPLSETIKWNDSGYCQEPCIEYKLTMFKKCTNLKTKLTYFFFLYLSSFADQVILKFYKSEKEQEAGKELRRERFEVSAQNFCGIESCYRHPKNRFVLTVICTDRIALLSFSCHADLLDWYHKIRNQLISGEYYKDHCSRLKKKVVWLSSTLA